MYVVKSKANTCIFSIIYSKIRVAALFTADAVYCHDDLISLLWIL